jgi:hypothetical protein
MSPPLDKLKTVRYLLRVLQRAITFQAIGEALAEGSGVNSSVEERRTVSFLHVN